MPRLSDYPKFKDIKSLIPPLNSTRYKGQSGKLLVVGGSKEYCGAPYFASTSSLLLGLDLCHVVCYKDASSIIKTYSPELIVHPIIDEKFQVSEIVNEFEKLADRVDGFVVGPGLGRESFVMNCLQGFLKVIRDKDKPVVVDADGLYFLTQYPDSIINYSNAILTPNLVEFKRLCKVMKLEPDDFKDPMRLVCELSKAFGNVCIVEKGPIDRVAYGAEGMDCDIPGGLKRCGGQGDILSGMLGALMIWRKFYHTNQFPNDGKLDEKFTMQLMGWVGCALTRTCSYRSFHKYRRATQASNMLEEIGPLFYDHFDHDNLN